MRNLLKGICVLLLIFSCQPTDEVLIENKKTNDVLKRGAPELQELTITYYSSVTEARKRIIREKYISNGILIFWEECNVVPNTEIWAARCCVIEEDTGEIKLKVGRFCEK